MNLYSNSLYTEDVRYVCELELPWEKLRKKNIMISGASGMIGSFLTDVLLEKNLTHDLDYTVYVLGRSPEELRERFIKYSDDKHLRVLHYDAGLPLTMDAPDSIDHVFHLASNTHPLLYATDPIGTITTNIIGLQNLSEFAVKHHAERFVFASSNEIYGENRGDVEMFDETYCGYIDSNTMRAGYPESKRCGESLCQAYKAQKGLNVVIPRLTRTYGPTMKTGDSKAISQFIMKAVKNEDIVLKSCGTQYYSYQYVSDSVSGLLTVFFKGKSGEAYNIANQNSDITLKALAELIAEVKGRKVIFEIPDAVEASGYSKATKARLDGDKLGSLGWKPKYNIRTGIERTIRILEEII